jgi:hypothetical protein
MDNVHTLHAWTLHLSRKDNEWEALCGAPHPEMLSETSDPKLHGLRTCQRCQKKVPRSRRQV